MGRHAVTIRSGASNGERPRVSGLRRRRRGAGAHDNLAAQARAGHDRRDLEQQADQGARRLRHGERLAAGREDAVAATLTPPGAGRPLQGRAGELAQQGLGLRADALRVHDDRGAQALAMGMGARALADGGNIYLAPGEHEQDENLMAHELAHVGQRVAGPHARSATWLERRAWRSFFDHYLPRKFLDNYMDDTGAPITLNLVEMMDVNPIVNIRRSEGFATELTGLQAQVKASAASGKPAPAIKYIEVNGPGQALTNGTLGNFTIRYKGVLSVNPDGTWTFAGNMEFYDVWDFDPKPFGTSGRSTAGELKTRVAAEFLPGSSFEIFSVPSLCVQTGADRSATWPGGSPRHVPDQAGRAGADVEVSGAGGDVGGTVVSGGDVGVGDVGGAGGVEVGAQSAEDLNP